MKPWQLNKRVNNLSSQLADSTKTGTTIDWNCLSEPERQLIDKIVEIINQYAPAQPPQDIIEKNATYGTRAWKSLAEEQPNCLLN